MPKNYLDKETSPYLQQHVDNPVEWFPWGEIALKKAADENKPILLSIGYSACHWCHVMAHESFEDHETAKLMNKYFINIKVDREERPDIDKIYQTAQFVLTQRNGGWPLTMFLTPHDQIPFFGGTYFPKEARHGLPAFKDLLHHIANTYKEKADGINKQNQSLQNVLNNIYQSIPSKSEIEQDILKQAKNQLLKTFDMQHGGFGSAPKFPHPSNIDLLLRDWYLSKQSNHEDSNVLHAAVFSCEKMAAGGLFDHVSGGFYRYSVDDYWMIPHFEKMLYDNGPLLNVFSQIYLATKEPRFKQTAQQTAEWVMRDMQSTEGGYYSSLDADSEGEEGKYYTWDEQLLESLLEPDELLLVKKRFGIERGPNFEDTYHLHEFMSLEEVAYELDLAPEQCQQQWLRIREKLFQHRVTRVAPGRDEKILTSWNGLMIKAMLIASRIMQNTQFYQSASRALQFIRQDMFVNGRLFATYKDKKAHLNAYLDDYAFLIDALLEQLQTQWSDDYLQFAIQIAEILLTQFEDKQQGGFFFTSNDHETLIQRPKVYSDEATPAGNGIAAYCLLRLGYLLSETRYIQAAESAVTSASTHINNTPMAHASMLKCYEELFHSSETIIIRGEEGAIKSWQQPCQLKYSPNRSVYAIPSDAKNLPDGLETKAAQKNTIAYYCKGMQCDAPIDSLEKLSQILTR